jgi:ribosome-associated toxin RatA of RatAB toxin-antitoxin module
VTNDARKTERAARNTFSWLCVAVASTLFACGEKRVDWSAPENFVYHEESDDIENGVRLEYWSLVDAACKPIYEALYDVEHYPEFIPGVDQIQIIDRSDTSKTVLIAQRVISRQSNAKVKWTFDASKPRVAFETLTSDFSFNDGTYDFESSPDGKRCLVKSVFVVKPGERGQTMATAVVAQATRDAYMAASRGVKKRVSGGAG